MVLVRAKGTGSCSSGFEILVKNSEGTLCAAGSAGIGSHADNTPTPSHYPRQPLPDSHQLKEARAANLPAGTQLGTLDFHMEPDGLESWAAARGFRVATIEAVNNYAGKPAERYAVLLPSADPLTAARGDR